MVFEDYDQYDDKEKKMMTMVLLLIVVGFWLSCRCYNLSHLF